MTVSKRAQNRVLNVKGYAFVDPKEVPNLTQRFTESYIRRRLFALEDDIVLRQYRVYQSVYREMSSEALRLAGIYGVSKLDNTREVIAYRRALSDYMTARLQSLAGELAQIAYEGVVLGHLVAYYGKAWMLDSLVDIDLRIPRLSADAASRAVMDHQILEDVGSKLIYDLLGAEWRETYANEIDRVILDIRQVMRRGMGEGQTIPQLMNKVAGVLGVDIDRRHTGVADVRANFNRVQAITRSYFIDSNNRAALGLYQSMPSIVQFVRFITANDNRVCPTCLGYGGQEWELMSPAIVHPVTDTHPLCRCSLIPIVYESANAGGTLSIDGIPAQLLPDDAAPPSLFGDWLMGLGLNWLWNQLGPDDIDSPRVYDDELDTETQYG